MDIKKKQFAVLDMEKRKVLDRKYELRLSCIYHRKYSGETVEFSDFALKFFGDASKIMVKNLGSESAYVAANYKSVMWGKGYWRPEMKAGEAKEECKRQFDQMRKMMKMVTGMNNSKMMQMAAAMKQKMK